MLDEVVATLTFRALLPAGADRVWAALTCPEGTAHWFHGMSLRSTWQPGDPVRLSVPGGPGGPGGPVIEGQVLCVRAPYHLSFSVEDDSGTATYVTWTLRPVAGGCVVRLEIHETPGDATTEELEDVWLPVLDGLRTALAAPPAPAAAG